MPRYAHNKMSLDVKRRYFELIRTGMRGARAAAEVGVSLSCGSVWFIDAGSVSFVETPISGRYLSQDDRIEIADGLDRGERVKVIAARIGKSHQSVYREIARNRKPNGHYQPWYAHNQAHLRRQRPKSRRLATDPALREVVAGKLRCAWSPAQISKCAEKTLAETVARAQGGDDHPVPITTRVMEGPAAQVLLVAGRGPSGWSSAVEATAPSPGCCSARSVSTASSKPPAPPSSSRNSFPPR
ncbi:hypothetical protein Q0Z83_000380 [Actinoplanes sichuanensis]|uniref:Transposase n=1 Tax=Actinoplanes sichuanensis TaxID=512349 RepID=A0ABW4A2T3_9ACTN|nr:helix-turn-helix domain-containing protein [Actinoplanes sichuanensis]BEL01847.1 hypothetical protein Q0Z83_000380 [Actinoplanes sichuanensis]